MSFRKAAKTLPLCALALALTTPVMNAAPPVVMKVLVLTGTTNEASYRSITTYLTQVGVPYQGVALRSITPDSSGNRMSKVPLSDSAAGRGLYQGIILADSTFAACSPSCLSAADWVTLNNYESQYAVRVASYYTLPQAQWGLLPADSGTNYTTASPLSVNLTTAGAAVFPYLNSSNAIAVGAPGTGIRAYRATTTAASNETTTPLLTAGAYTVAAAHTAADGRETLALTMDNAPTLLHSVAFSYGVINWVTKGIFLGSRRVYLNPQIDDMLLGNRLYAPTLPECPDADTCPTLFATAQDIQALVNWQNGLKADSLFSTFRNTYAFNGVGTTWFDPSDPVFGAIRSLGSNFSWLSHTWDHANLDCYSINSSGACVPANLAQSKAELDKNISVAPSLGINLDRTSMVTPFNGGLGNTNFVNAAVQSGLQYIVTAVLPAAVNTGTVNPRNAGIYEIPRVKSIFDDVSVPQTGAYGSWTDEFNALYGPNGSQPTYSQNQTYSQILNNESNNLLINTVLAYQPYLLAFHIDNSAVYDGTHSIFSDLLDATIAKYKNLFTLPVLTMEMKDLAPVLKTRSSYNASGVVGVYTPGVSVVLTTTKAATIPVTGICSQPACGTYGGQIQDNVVMAASSTVTLSLTSVEGVSLATFSLNPTSVTGGTSATGTLTLTGGAPSNGVVVALSSNSGSAVVPASVTIPAGSSTANFTVTTTSVSASVSVTLTASYGGISKTASLSVTPAAPAVALSGIAVAPASLTGGTAAAGTVTLSAVAPAGGLVVSLNSNNTLATVPASVTVAAGSSSANFTVNTSPVGSTRTATITGSYNGVNKSATLSINPSGTLAVVSVSVSPASIKSELPATGTVTISAAAPAGGTHIELWTTGTVAFVPVGVTIPAGATTATFNVATNYTTTTLQDTITAFYNGVSKTAPITVTP